MIIKDRVYGKIKIKEKVIQELILSKPMQRLTKISQDGASHFIQPIRNVNRFEHSIGVWYLSSLFKRPIEEQIACLLHDIPHTAFSHVIDIVMEDEHHEFHEKFTEEIILNSNIPNILSKYNIDLKKVLQKENFPLLENALPDISFDRWDYFMRDGYMMEYLPMSLINEFISNIFEKKDILFFKDVRIASTFAILFTNFSRLIWLDPISHGSYFLLAKAIKIALDKKIISQKDFFTNDTYLLNKLKSSKNYDITKLLNKLSPGHEFIYTSKKDAEFYGPNKPRYIDPLVKSKNKLVRLSDLVPNLKYFFSEFSTNYKYLGVKPLQ